MAWVAYLADTTTGLIDKPIDIPHFSWNLTISDSSLSSTQDNKGTGAMDTNDLTIPWASIPAATQAERESNLSALRRSIVLFWHTDNDGLEMGVPILMGAIGARTDTWLDTSFSLESPLSILDSRYCVREGVFGTAPGSTTQNTISFNNMSFRGIASEVGNICTNQKPGGYLPIDWTYLGEAGTHQRNYKAFDVANLSCKAIFAKLSGVIGGPDMQLRPYMADSKHIRLQFLAGSDADVYLTQSGTIPSLQCFPGGGNVQDVKIAHSTPAQRVYTTGSGQDEALLCHLSEDLTMVYQSDPWPLMEMSYNNVDEDNANLVKNYGDGKLKSHKNPLVQLTCTLDANDEHCPTIGTFWPGEIMCIQIDGYPSFPDGNYFMRLMEMTGDETSQVRLKFDVYDDPWYERG